MESALTGGKTISDVMRTNAIVWQLTNRGADYETIICALAHQQEVLGDRLMTAEMIAPRKYKFPDGQAKVWRCPDEMIPLTDLSQFEKGTT